MNQPLDATTFQFFAELGRLGELFWIVPVGLGALILFSILFRLLLVLRGRS